jgi:Zn-dependent metalloprotease
VNPRLDTFTRTTSVTWPRVHTDTPLNGAAVANDPVAATANRTVAQFDDFLAKHDAPAIARVPDGFDVILAPQSDNASANEGEIMLGAKPDVFARPSGLSTEIVGHELVHSVAMRAGIGTSEPTDEGWADIVGNAFARSVGAPEAADWKVGEGDFQPRHQLSSVRDLSRPKVFDVPALQRYLQSWRSPSFDEHHTPGPLTRAATQVAKATSPETMGTIFTEAFLHDLKPRIAQAQAETPAPPADHEGPWEPHFLGELRASAQATIDAATRLHGAPSPELAAVRDAWLGVGVGA